MTKTNVPKLRFKGFNGNLKSLTYNDLFDEFSYGLSKSGKSYDGKNKYLRITDITDDSRSFSKENLVSPDIDFEDKNNVSYLLNENDIVFARTGASTGKTYLYDKKDGRVYYAGFLIKGHVNHSFDSKYIFTSTLTDMYNNFIKVTSMRSGQPGINSKEYSMYSLNIPSKDEQQKIGSFFAKIDKIIDLQEKKIQELKKLKQGYLQKMFPQDGESVPKLRFSRFSGEWKKKNISEITTRLDNKRVPVKEQDRVSGNVPYYGANGIQGYVEGFTHTGNNILIAEDGASDVNNYPVIFTKGNIWVNNHAHVLQSKDDKSDSSFMSFALKLIRYSKYLTGNGRYKLNADVLMKINLLVPSIEEQQKISEFLSNIDKMINNQSKKIDALKQQKKAYLQKMFI
ncbi:hypothetical protein AKUH4B410M_04820 [Apilactobacillus kunkeei]|nr:hypothetical protein AKUH4B405J_04820 [Apilactobacillus kunkeei]CAI2580727.1 hypothetical protein AKUH4B102A_04840 [Apilactobacillus kunkeei]CAI2581744.1 hypothetical protein AKUH4B410M_04820 [Apilactobacillus kunkeei]CAI2652426.1 hypothetical protein AKUH3B102X_04810 [Apilactobacillus kunkeei]